MSAQRELKIIQIMGFFEQWKIGLWTKYLTNTLTSSIRKSLTSCSKQLSFHFLVMLSHFSWKKKDKYNIVYSIKTFIFHQHLPIPSYLLYWFYQDAVQCYTQAWWGWCGSPESQRSHRSLCRPSAPYNSVPEDQTSYSSSQSTDCRELW